VAVCDGNRAWIEWAGFEKDDHRLVEIVCPRLKCLAIAPEDCFADDGGLGKIVINPFEREGFYLRRIGKTRQRMSLSVDHPLTPRLWRGFLVATRRWLTVAGFASFGVGVGIGIGVDFFRSVFARFLANRIPSLA
jgi:hypothetical protein